MLDFLKRIFQRPRLAPVSKALTVEAGVLERQILNAIAAVDQVHTDGALPDLPVKAASLVDMYGYFQNTTGEKAVEIVVSSLNPHAELTVVHEIGHFLDFKGLDRSTLWASVNSPALAPWREAIKRSRAAQTLGHFLDPTLRTATVTLWDGSVVEYPVDKSYVGYLLKAEELWARSYSQFIATQSRDPELMQQLERERKRPISGIYYPKHWDDADFQPILAEMEAVFRGLRWMR